MSKADPSPHGDLPSAPPQAVDEPHAEGLRDEDAWRLEQAKLAEVDPDELFAMWAEQDRLEAEEQAHSERFSMGRHPLLLALVFVLSCSLTYRSWPAVEALISFDEVGDCGRVIDRPLMEARGESPVPFQHLKRCELEGVVQQLTLIPIGFYEDESNADMFAKNKGVSYVVKLSGGDVFAILPAHEPWVEGHRLKEGSLFGLEFKAAGLMIQPAEEPVYQRLAARVKEHFQVKPSAPVWIFDVSYSPWDHKTPLVTFALSPLLALLALFGLTRALKASKHNTPHGADAFKV